MFSFSYQNGFTDDDIEWFHIADVDIIDMLEKIRPIYIEEYGFDDFKTSKLNQIFSKLIRISSTGKLSIYWYPDDLEEEDDE